MSYEKIDGVPVMTNEFAALLDSGDVVAVGLSRSVKGSRMVFSGLARAIEMDGSQRLNRWGSPIQSRISYSDTRAPLIDLLSKDCVLALLGEPPETIQWSEQFLLDVSIRQAIAVSQIGNADPSNLI